MSSDRTDGLLAQHNLLLNIIETDWATRLDHKVAAVIIQRYYPRYGNARASLRFIAEATRADRSNVKTSIRRLVDRGAFAVLREGKGTRPTEFTLNFAFSPSGGVTTPSTSGGAVTPSCEGAATPSSEPSGGVTTPETYIQLPADRTGILVCRTFEDAPMAPPDSALYGPAGAVPSSGGFEEFWSVWPRKHKLAKAKAAYKAIAPDADLHATIAEAARAWATHYASNNVEKKWVPEPASWLANERWLEDLPLIHGDAKGAAIAKAKANAPAKPKAAATFKVDATCKIEAAELEMDGNDQVIVVTFAPEGGNSFDRRIVLESPDPKRQAEGQGEFSRLCEAINVDEPKDAEDLMGFSLHIWGGNKGLAYNRLPPAWLTDRSAQAA